MKSFIVSAAVLGMASTSWAAAIPEVVPLSSGVVWTDDAELYKRSNSDQICIQFQSSDIWYYSMTGIWGSAAGPGPSSPGNLCIARNDAQGGAMFIGPNPQPGAGSTKFECYFPTSGSPNCDISLVDGYSLSMSCKLGSQSLGGSVDLWSAGGSCKDKSGTNCVNTIGANAAGQDAIDAFFQPAVENGNNYCIWYNCNQIVTFGASDSVYCIVSGGSDGSDGSGSLSGYGSRSSTSSSQTAAGYGSPSSSSTAYGYGSPSSSSAAYGYGSPSSSGTAYGYGSPSTSSAAYGYGSPSSSSTAYGYGGPSTSSAAYGYGSPSSSSTAYGYGGPSTSSAAYGYGSSSTFSSPQVPTGYGGRGGWGGSGEVTETNEGQVQIAEAR